MNFISFHKPNLTDGVYDLTVSQNFTVAGADMISPEKQITHPNTQHALKIAALGPRFTLDPQLVEHGEILFCFAPYCF